MADLHTRLATYRRQRAARGASTDELALLDELEDELTRLELVGFLNEDEANNLRPGLPSGAQP